MNFTFAHNWRLASDNLAFCNSQNNTFHAIVCWAITWHCSNSRLQLGPYFGPSLPFSVYINNNKNYLIYQSEFFKHRRRETDLQKSDSRKNLSFTGNETSLTVFMWALVGYKVARSVNIHNMILTNTLVLVSLQLVVLLLAFTFDHI